MAARVLLLSNVCYRANQLTLLQNESLYSLQILSRGLKDHLLFKEKKKKKLKYRDGKEYTVDHLYWEHHFKNNPAILEERSAINIKNAKIVGKKPLGPARIYETLTQGDKR